MSDLSDECQECGASELCDDDLRVLSTKAEARMLRSIARELLHHRARLATDRVRVRQVVNKAWDDACEAMGLRMTVLAHRDLGNAIATRVADELCNTKETK
jgi:hypothetical protein